ncbi:uncharacterized protein LOC121381554 [Gigantopelta aegis]|uniref:uncharacterized protein LOC121381554 n=1 Tax=Gigantopelta aegis TaxID=1735272 RepID=UPI001B88C0D8|nr:uncharacterized protein LOC121381554 [Gigantopelta aegis]
MVERFNRIVQHMLSMYVDEHRRDWDEHLPYVMMVYRASTHESTKCSPNKLMLGREIFLPIACLVGKPPKEPDPPCPIEYVEWVQDALEEAHEFVRGNLSKSALRQKRHYDLKLKERSYKVGEWVWYWYPPDAKQKLGKGWTGPYLVIKRLSDIMYVIQEKQRSRPRTIHVDHLKRCTCSDLPLNWLETDVIDGRPGEQVERTDMGEEVDVDMGAEIGVDTKEEAGRNFDTDY